MATEQEKIEVLKKLPLRWHTGWIHIKELFPGTVIEEERGLSGFNAIDIGDPEIADEVVRIHNKAIGRV